MEQPATSDIAQHGDQIEVTAPNRTDFGKRYQVESSRPSYIHVLDNRLRVQIEHEDYKIVKRCGKPATEAPKKVGRPSNAELAARAVEASKEATKDVPVVTKEEIAALEQAIDVPVTRKTIDERAERVAHFKHTRKQPEVQPAPHAQVGDVIKITHGENVKNGTRYKRGTELKVKQTDDKAIVAHEIAYSPFIWNFIVLHGDYEIVSTASQEKAIADVPVEPSPQEQRVIELERALADTRENSRMWAQRTHDLEQRELRVSGEPVELKITQEQFDAMTKQDPAESIPDIYITGTDWAPRDDMLDAIKYAMAVPKHLLDGKPKHSHYFKPCPFDQIDVYRVLSLFNVTDPCLQHAVKKLLVAGGRGHKDIQKDVQDSIDTLERWKAMRAEEAA